MSDIQTLKAYAKGRKLPLTVFLGKADKEWTKETYEFFKTLPITSDIALAQREQLNVKGTEIVNYSELTNSYNQKYFNSSIVLPDQIKKLEGVFHLRFGVLNPNSIIPYHIDEPFTLRFMCLIKGSHVYKSEGIEIHMSEGDIYYINGCYKHSIENNNNEERVALLGKFSFNPTNVEHLNELL